MELRDALIQIAEIRTAVAATQRFSGYRALPVSLTGALAIVGACVQPLVVTQPLSHVEWYLGFWSVAAVLGLVAAGVRIAAQDLFDPRPLNREVTRVAVTQFLPCVVAGLLLTLVVARQNLAAAALMPGLWQMLFGLGIFASIRSLPRAAAWVGVWYVLSGTYHLAVWAPTPDALAPMVMGLPFGVGQLALAAVLYWNLERADGHPRSAG